MVAVHQIIDKLSHTSGMNDKIDIIKEHSNNPYFVVVLKLTFDKINTNYWIKKIPIPEIVGGFKLDSDAGMSEIKSKLTMLSSRQVTGHAGIALVKELLEKFYIEDQKVITMILEGDLRCNVSDTSINKAIPNLIPVFDVVLAKNFNDNTGKIDTGEWVIARKLDGLRNLAIKSNDTFRFFSREGKEFFTLDALIKPLLVATQGIDDVVFDGEICLVDDNGKEDFQGIVSQIKKKDHTISNPKYLMFDMLTKDEFYSGKGTRSLSTRHTLLFNAIRQTAQDKLKFVDQIPYTEESFAEMSKNVEKFGWEGLMLRRADVGYKNKRTDQLLKVKKFFDEEFIVENAVMGDFAYSVKGIGQTSEVMLSSVEIRLDTGDVVNVGSGFTIEQRKEFYKHPERIIGKTICVQFFEKTKNVNGGNSLRFPTCKWVYSEKRDT